MKLVLVEAESDALQDYLADAPRLVTSTLAAIEVPRAVRRAVGEQGVLLAEQALNNFLLLPYDARLELNARLATPSRPASAPSTRFTWPPCCSSAALSVQP